MAGDPAVGPQQTPNGDAPKHPLLRRRARRCVRPPFGSGFLRFRFFGESEYGSDDLLVTLTYKLRILFRKIAFPYMRAGAGSGASSLLRPWSWLAPKSSGLDDQSKGPLGLMLAASFASENLCPPSDILAAASTCQGGRAQRGVCSPSAFWSSFILSRSCNASEPAGRVRSGPPRPPFQGGRRATPLCEVRPIRPPPRPAPRRPGIS
eukprot:976252-Prorocentrum_minimum.AAC.4